MSDNTPHKFATIDGLMKKTHLLFSCKSQASTYFDPRVELAGPSKHECQAG